MPNRRGPDAKIVADSLRLLEIRCMPQENFTMSMTSTMYTRISKDNHAQSNGDGRLQ